MLRSLQKNRRLIRPRPSAFTLPALGMLLFLFILTLADAAWRSRNRDDPARRALVRELGLSDLALFTEARYTRHPALADHHAPFQDHPAALEHFPTGSLAPPSPPIPDSRSPIPDPRFPIPDSRSPIPDPRFPIPDPRP